MKTAIRTYHPIPSLQRTNGNMQDAPRIKHILKTSLLEDEAKAPPSTPSDILARCVRHYFYVSMYRYPNTFMCP
jgi:Ino eighty subunit 1